MIQQPKPQRVRSASYLVFVRQHVCVARRGYDPLCSGAIEANHVLPNGGGKTGSKTDDSRSLPFCQYHHRRYHAIGREAFESLYCVELEKEITLLNLEFSFQQPKTPRTRTRQPEVRAEIRHCICGRKHLLPMSKVMIRHDALVFTCPLKSLPVKVQK